MTVQELIEVLQGYDASSVVAVTVRPRPQAAILPVSDNVVCKDVVHFDEHYQCVVLTLANWP